MFIEAAVLALTGRLTYTGCFASHGISNKTVFPIKKAVSAMIPPPDTAFFFFIFIFFLSFFFAIFYFLRFYFLRFYCPMFYCPVFYFPVLYCLVFYFPVFMIRLSGILYFLFVQFFQDIPIPFHHNSFIILHTSLVHSNQAVQCTNSLFHRQAQ